MLLPRLKTACSTPLSGFDRLILSQSEVIENWFAERWKETPPSITTSIDLRYSGYKLAPIDTNLFPAGFNNLPLQSRLLCAQALRYVLLNRMPGCKRVLILPENHTRNLFYLQSLHVLRECFIEAGFDVRIGSLDDQLTEPKLLDAAEEGYHIEIEPLVRQGRRIYVQDFDPCILVLNHDLSGGIPDILQDLEQPIHPTLQLGWGSRLKSSHFSFYDHVAHDFSCLVGLEPWLINPIFTAVHDVDFMQQTGLDALAVAIDDVLTQIKTQYQAHGIQDRPFVMVKADNGTYGMSVMAVYEGQEMLRLNRKQRTRMSARKESQAVSKVIIQEGIYSIERMSQNEVAEPVMYLIDSFVVGGFYRIHHSRLAHESLNTPGMFFEPMAFQTPDFEPYRMARTQATSERFYIYSVVARLAAMAAAREIAAVGGVV